MIYDNPPLKEDEWLFGYLLRYNAYVGNIEFEDTLLDWYNNVFPIRFHFIPVFSEMKKIVPDLCTYISHGIIPYYEAFTNRFHSLEIKNFMNSSFNPMNDYFVWAPDFARISNIIKYCPICMYENFGMFYREHQIDEVQICIRHNCFLNRIRIQSQNYKGMGTLLRRLDFSVSYPERNDMYLYVAKQSIYLLKHPGIINKRILTQSIRNVMLKNGMAKRKYSSIISLVEDDYIKFLSPYVNYIDMFKLKDMEYFTLQHIISTSPRLSTQSYCPMEFLLAVNFLFGGLDKISEIDQINL